MDEPEGLFVAVRRISHGLERGEGCHSTSGSTAWIGRGLSCVCAQRREDDARISFDLTSLQEVCFHRLQNRVEVTYDSSRPQHQEALRALWYAAFPEEKLRDLISEQWKRMGWQGKDPSTDFRGGGYISLENLLFLAKTFPKAFNDLLHKREGNRALLEYPFAVAGVNITFMLIQMLDLLSVKPQSLARAVFVRLLSDSVIVACKGRMIIDPCVSIESDAVVYMEDQKYQSVVKATRAQLERELILEDISCLEDMPSYRLLLQ